MTWPLGTDEVKSLFSNIRGKAFEVSDLIGTGGFKYVYKAIEVGTGQHVALKLFNPAEADLHRISREAAAMKAFSSPHIARLLDSGLGDQHGYPYLLEEFISGGSLDKRLSAKPVQSNAELNSLIPAMLSALIECGKHGIVHRDIKPQNILIRQSGEPVLTDFGISRHTRLTTLTATGVPGPGFTVQYAAPEQVDIVNYRSDQIDAQTDLFAFGIVIYEASTGKHPFWASHMSFREIMTSILNEEPPPAHVLNSNLPQEYSAFVARLLKKRKFKRFDDAADAADAFNRVIVHM